jgi:hypothetical protein
LLLLLLLLLASVLAALLLLLLLASVLAALLLLLLVGVFLSVCSLQVPPHKGQQGLAWPLLLLAVLACQPCPLPLLLLLLLGRLVLLGPRGLCRAPTQSWHALHPVAPTAAAAATKPSRHPPVSVCLGPT